MAATSSVSSTGRLAKIGEATRALLKRELLVGVPDTAAERQPEPGQKGKPPSNALVGYTMEFGSDQHNIPPRPFLVPGVANAKDAISAALKVSATGAMAGKMNSVDAGFVKAGNVAVNAVKVKMQEGPFAPLSERTIRERAERRYADTGKLVGAKSNREAREYLKLQAQGTPTEVLQDVGLAQPLIDTRSLITSIQSVIRDKDAR